MAISSFSSYPPRGKKSDFHVGYRSISDSHEPVSFDRLWRHVHPSTLSVYRCPYHGPMILVELHRRHCGSGVLTNYIFLPTFYVIRMATTCPPIIPLPDGRHLLSHILSHRGRYLIPMTAFSMAYRLSGAYQ